MFGVAPYTGAQFFAYAKLNQFAADRARTYASNPVVEAAESPDRNSVSFCYCFFFFCCAAKNPQTGKPEVGVLTKLFCGAAAGLLAQSITFPTGPSVRAVDNLSRAYVLVE